MIVAFLWSLIIYYFIGAVGVGIVASAHEVSRSRLEKNTFIFLASVTLWPFYCGGWLGWWLGQQLKEKL